MLGMSKQTAFRQCVCECGESEREKRRKQRGQKCDRRGGSGDVDDDDNLGNKQRPRLGAPPRRKNET